MLLLLLLIIVGGVIVVDVVVVAIFALEVALLLRVVRCCRIWPKSNISKELLPLMIAVVVAIEHRHR